MTFYHKKQHGFFCCEVSTLQDVLVEVEEMFGDMDCVIVPMFTPGTGSCLAVQTSEEDGRWFVGYIDLGTMKFHPCERGDKRDENPAHGPSWSYMNGDLVNINTNWERP